MKWLIIEYVVSDLEGSEKNSAKNEDETTIILGNVCKTRGTVDSKCNTWRVMKSYETQKKLTVVLPQSKYLNYTVDRCVFSEHPLDRHWLVAAARPNSCSDGIRCLKPSLCLSARNKTGPRPIPPPPHGGCNCSLHYMQVQRNSYIHSMIKGFIPEGTWYEDSYFMQHWSCWFWRASSRTCMCSNFIA